MLYNQAQKEITASSSDWIDWNDACENCAYDLNAAATNSSACFVCATLAPKKEITTYNYFDLPLILVMAICGLVTIFALAIKKR